MKKGIRVGIITENHFPRFGGMEFCNHFLAVALNKLPDVHASVSCGTLPEVPADFSYPYPVYRAKSCWRLTPWLHRRNRERMIRQERLNILHGSMLHGGGLRAVEIGRQFDLLVVVQSHGSDVQMIPEIGYGARLRPEIESSLRHVIENADKIVAVSKMNKDMLLELGAEENKVNVIHNGIPYEEIGVIPYEDMRSKYGLNPDGFVIITVGRNRPIKRMDLLFKALALLKRTESQIKCMCVGPFEDLPHMVKMHGLEDRIVLTGPVPRENMPTSNVSPPFQNLINLYRSVNLFVSVSYVESFNNSAGEALACGTPVLIGEKQGIRDVIREGETGFVLHDETPEHLAEMLVTLSRKRRELEQQRQNIRNSVSHLTWENTAKQFRDIYLSLLH